MRSFRVTLFALALLKGLLVSHALPSPPSAQAAVSARCTQQKIDAHGDIISGSSIDVSRARRRRRRRTTGRSLAVRADQKDEVLALSGGAVATDDKAAKFKRKSLFFLTYLSYIGIYFARKPMSVLKPVLQEEMGMTQAGLGFVDTAMLAAYALGQIALGQVSRLVSTRTLLTLSFVVAGLSTSMMATCSSSEAMAGWASLAGLASSPANPLLVLFVADLFPPHMRASVVGLWQTSAQVGGIAANNAAAAVLALKGWRAVLLGCGAVVAAFALPLNLAVKAADTGDGDRDEASKAAAAAAAASGGGPSTAETLALPGVASVGAAYALVKMARYCLMLWLPTFFSQRVGMPPATAGAMASLFDAGGVAGGVCAGILTDAVLGGKMVATAGFMSAGAGAAFLAWATVVKAGSASSGGTQSVPLNAAAMLVSGFLIAGPDGILGGAASKNLCDYNAVKGGGWAPAVAGMVNGVASLAVIAMSAYTAKLVEVLGWDGLFGLLAALSVVAAALTYPAISLERKHFAKLSS